MSTVNVYSGRTSICTCTQPSVELNSVKQSSLRPPTKSLANTRKNRINLIRTLRKAPKKLHRSIERVLQSNDKSETLSTNILDPKHVRG